MTNVRSVLGMPTHFATSDTGQAATRSYLKCPRRIRDFGMSAILMTVEAS